MKYGINMLLWTDDATGEQFVPLFRTIKEIGYDGVEIPIFSADVKRFEKLGKTLDSIGLGSTAVTVCSEAADPMSADPDNRARGVAALKTAVDCCAALGSSLLVGPLHSALGVFSGASPTADQRARSAESLREAATYAAQHNVTFAIEYLNRFEAYALTSAVDTVAFLKQVDHPNCRMMYDTFHAHIEEKNVRAAIHTGGKNIVHVHISENDRSTPGVGQVNWTATFDALSEIAYDGWFTVEAFGLALQALAAATKIWRRMYDYEEKLVRDALAFMKSEWEKRTSELLV